MIQITVLINKRLYCFMDSRTFPFSLKTSSRLLENDINNAKRNIIIMIQIETGVAETSLPMKSLKTNPIEIVKTSRIAIFRKMKQ